MHVDKGDNDQSDNIKSNEGHRDMKLHILYHSKFIGTTKMLTRILHKIIINNRHIFLFNKTSW